MLNQTKEITVKNKLEAEQLFKISRFKEVIKRTKPHKHEAYFEIIFLSKGAGFHWVDTQKFQIKPPVVFFLSGQMHYWEMTAIPKGYVLLFKEQFFNFLKQGDLLNLVHSLQDVVNVNLSDDDNLDFIFSEMEKEYKDPSTNTIELIQGYLQVVLIKLLRHKEIQTPLKVNGIDQVFRKFLHLVQNANPISNLKVKEAATTLNVTPQNLNAITRKVSGKSASELISEQVTLEAKRYLIHTDRTVSEIAFALNFSDPSHFVKYFKKLIGETPQSFREKHFH
jgi:AraC family transcriptional regulator, transcriptional activator of pobA